MADLTITAANVVPGAGAQYQSGTCIAGAAITAGQPVYKWTDGKYYPAIANSSRAGNVDAMPVGIALNSAAIGQTVSIQTSGQMVVGATTVKGTVYALSKNSGNIGLLADLTSGNFVTVLGQAIDNAGTFQVNVWSTGQTM